MSTKRIDPDTPTLRDRDPYSSPAPSTPTDRPVLYPSVGRPSEGSSALSTHNGIELDLGIL